MVDGYNVIIMMECLPVVAAEADSGVLTDDGMGEESMEVENLQADALIGLKINSNDRHCWPNVLYTMLDCCSLVQVHRRDLLNVPDIPRYKTWMNKIWCDSQPQWTVK